MSYYLQPEQVLWDARSDLADSRIKELTEQGVTECMREQGFVYDPIVPNWARPEEEAALAKYRETPRNDVEYASEYGYGMELDYLHAKLGGQDENGDVKATSPFVGGVDTSQSESVVEAALDALTSEGGCQDIGETKVLGVPRAEYQSAQEEIRNRVLGLTDTDTGYLEAQKQWSACMTESGYSGIGHLDTPWEYAKDLASGKMTDAEYLDKQRELAVADAKCHKESGLVESFNQAILNAAEQAKKEMAGEYMATTEALNNLLEKDRRQRGEG